MPSSLSSLRKRSHENNSPKINLPLTCANCNGPHFSKDLSYPEKLIQIRKLAATKNIPLLEARKTIRSMNLKTNSQFDFSSFPDLNDSPTPNSLFSFSNISFPPSSFFFSRSYANATKNTFPSHSHSLPRPQFSSFQKPNMHSSLSSFPSLYPIHPSSSIPNRLTSPSPKFFIASNGRMPLS